MPLPRRLVCADSPRVQAKKRAKAGRADGGGGAPPGGGAPASGSDESEEDGPGIAALD